MHEIITRFNGSKNKIKNYINNIIQLNYRGSLKSNIVNESFFMYWNIKKNPLIFCWLATTETICWEITWIFHYFKFDLTNLKIFLVFPIQCDLFWFHQESMCYLLSRYSKLYWEEPFSLKLHFKPSVNLSVDSLS